MTAAISRERSRNYIFQLKGAFFFKTLAVLASFLVVPLMIAYLGQEQYGVWSTLLSIMSWVVFFDLGIGNGLRNKVAEALAKNDVDQAAAYISSGYTLIALVSLTLFIGLAAGSQLIPWQTVFNTTEIPAADLKYTVLISSFFICVNFWISLVNQVLNAVQKTSVVVAGQFLSNVLALILVFVLSRTNSSSILYLAIAYGSSLVMTNIIVSVWFYFKSRALVPRPGLDGRHVRPLLSLGVQFFSIQLAVLVIFSTDKILISQLFGPAYVTQYDVFMKVFSVVTLVHSLVTAPLWSAYADAYHRGDLSWIRHTLRQQLKFFGAIFLVVVALVPLANPVVALWISGSLDGSIIFILSIAVFVLVSVWNNIFGSILGGMNKIRLGSIYTVLTALMNIPLSYFFAVGLNLGVEGVVLGTVSSILVSAIISPIQVYYFIFTEQRNPILSRILR